MLRLYYLRAKSKFHDKKQAIQCIIQYIKIWFQSKYCGGNSTVEMQGERTVAKTGSKVFKDLCA